MWDFDVRYIQIQHLNTYHIEVKSPCLCLALLIDQNFKLEILNLKLGHDLDIVAGCYYGQNTGTFQ